ncbi:hypothetical protein G6F31_019386 [Rhizopus arrhizus]|nr:hypothetical protein G6F31_019386 [Rhizopus arrhizus]
MRSQERGGQIDLDLIIPGLLGHRDRVTRFRAADVVHQDVERPVCRDRPVDGSGIRHVQHQRRTANRLGAQRFADLRQLAFAPRRHRHMRAGAPQPGSRSQADAAAAARHQGPASVQAEVRSFWQRNHACASTGWYQGRSGRLP